MRSKLFRLFAVLIIVSMVVTPVSAKPNLGNPAIPAAGVQTATDPEWQIEEAGLDLISYGRPLSRSGVVGEIKGASGPANYIIMLQDPPLASYRGGIAGLAATSPEVRGQRKLDSDSPAALAYLSYLEVTQKNVLQAIQAKTSQLVKPIFTYQHAFNGFAITLTPQQAAEVAKMPGVAMVEREQIFDLDTDAGPEWIGAPAIWEATAPGADIGTFGEGVVVGIIDSGINSDHPSFAEVSPLDGYVHTNPLGAGVYLGWCVENPDFCNDKLIGAYEFSYAVAPPGMIEYPAPEDEDGHGSHTASTVAGNMVEAALIAPTLTFTRTISGVAPRANIIAFDVCYLNPTTGTGQCNGTALLGAVNQAVADSVDVINYSISGGADPYNDSVEMAFLAAFGAGTFVSTSAGNSGPGAGTLGHQSPWVSTTAAATHNRALVNSLEGLTGGDSAPPADMFGKGFTAGFGPAEIVYAANYVIPPATAEDARLCAPGAFPPGTFEGQIVVCDRGTYARVDKAASVADGGAGGYVLANDAASGNSLSGDAYVIPGVHITFSDGAALKTWLASGEGHMGSIAGVIEDLSPSNGDVTASFSSRGPNTALEILKPSTTAPGVDIWAVYATPDPANPGPAEYGFMSGTSMSSPHNAGAAALLMALHPDWTVAQVMSALMTTADDTVLIEDGVTPADPHAKGSGRIQVDRAAGAGLLLNETYANMFTANPASGGDPKTLNIASFMNKQCLQECSWTRTVTNPLDETVEWTSSFTAPPGGMMVSVAPAAFTLAPGASQQIVVTANVSGLPSVYQFAELILTPDSENTHLARFPLAVIPTRGVIPTSVTIDTRRNAGSQWVEDLTSIEITDLQIAVHGLTQASLHTEMLAQDPTNGDPYDGGPGAFFITKVVPEGAKRLVAEILESAAPDIDLFVGTGATPSAATEICSSTTPSWNESCDLSDPAAGTYWILVQNWQASTTPPDKVTLAAAVVPGEASSNFEVYGPSEVPQLEPFDLQLFWDTPEMVAGDRWYGALTLGTDDENLDNIGTIPVTVVRHADDVVKTADKEGAFFGDVVEYTITVASNVTPEDLAYTLNDTIPAGLTYVPGSASASSGSVSVEGNVVSWSGVLLSQSPRFTMATSQQDPGSCSVPLANSGAYLDLSAFGVNPQPAIAGDTIWFSAFSTGAPFSYWGGSYQGVSFTDDGMAFFASTPGDEPWVNQDIPNEADPNNLLAFFWNDWEVVYAAPPVTRGVSLANLGGTGPGGGVVIEYDDVQPWGDPTQTIDFEIFMWRSLSNAPGDYEIIFAYDNINLDTPIEIGTIGLENALGTDGLKYAYNDEALGTLEDGMAICFDWVMPTVEPVVITYQVTVDEDAAASPLTNTVVHDTDNPGSLPAETSFDLYILGSASKTVSSTLILPGELITYTIELGVGPSALETWSLTDQIPSGFEFVSVDGATYDAATHSIWWSGVLGSGEASILSEGFESTTFPPTGWTSYNVDGGGTQWVRSTTSAQSGTASAYHQYAASSAGMQEGWLVTPRLMVPGSASLSFWQRDTYSLGSFYNHHGVWISTASDPADQGSYVELWSGDTGTTWTQQTVDLSAYAGQNVYIGFKYTGQDADDWRIDDVVVSGTINNLSHTITLVLEGVVPGYYTNEALITTQSQTMTVAAPQVRVYGPEAAWGKEIWINADLYSSEDGPFPVAVGDLVTIVDTVSVEFDGDIAFELEESYDMLFDLVEYEVSAGSVVTGTGVITWSLDGGVSDMPYTLSKTFLVSGEGGWEGSIAEVLTISESPVVEEVMLDFFVPATLTKEATSSAYPGDVITYTLQIESPEGLTSRATLIDLLPAGVEFAGGLTASFGNAWYDEDENTVYWDNGAPEGLLQAPVTTAPQTDFAEATTKVGPAVNLVEKSPMAEPILSGNLVLLSEGFEAGAMPPSGWQVIEASTTTRHWTLIAAATHPTRVRSGAYAAWVNYEAADQDEWLISPVVDLSVVETAMVGFWVYANNNWVDGAELQLVVLDAEGVALNTLWYQSDEVWPYPSSHRYVSVDLNDYQGEQIRLAWRYFGNDGDSLALDDIQITGTVPAVIDLSFNALVTATSGTVVNSATLTTYGTDISASAETEVLPFEVTFMYHDLEGVLEEGDSLYIAGSFNGWNNTIDMLVEAAPGVFEITLDVYTGAHEYKYVVDRGGEKYWNFLQSDLNRSITVEGDMTANDYRMVSIGYYKLVGPAEQTINLTETTDPIYGEIWAYDLTQHAGAPPAIKAELGFGMSDDPTAWTTWVAMDWDSQEGNNDVFAGDLTPTELGVFSYAVRFSANWGEGNPNSLWYYGDLDWDDPAFNPGSLTVLDGAPAAGFSAPATAAIGQDVLFTNTTTGTEPISYLWNFGDGVTSTLPNPTHAFSVDGLYTVTLTATNDFGTDTFSKSIFIQPALPTHVDLSVDITISPLPVVVGVPTTFTAVVSNLGTAAATGVVVSGTLPATVEFISGENCAVEDGILTCDLGTIAAGASKTAVVVLKFTAYGAFEAAFEAFGVEEDVDLDNNVSEFDLNVEPLRIFVPLIHRN
jgi:uncharacterized repeat protein (TIGR01451 family)